MYDVAIVGGGPGGYAAALFAHNFGLSVALVEKDTVGGTCLLRGCIPAKSWLQAAEVYEMVRRASEFGVDASEPTMNWPVALARKQKVVDGLVRGLAGLLKARKVDVIDGYGRLADGGVEVTVPDPGGDGPKLVEARNVIIATGSVPRTIPGYAIDGERIVTSDHALDWAQQPRRVAVIGGGVIGCEFVSFLSDFGSEVYVFEALDQILPGTDPDAVKVLERILKKKGVSIRTGTTVGPAQISTEGVTVPFADEAVTVDVVLVAVGRGPVTDDIGLDAAGIAVDRGYIPVDLTTMQTSRPGVYAVGDVVAGTPQLAHAGFAEGIAAITHIATGTSAPVDYRAIPLVVYTHPEIASVGMTEAQATVAGRDVKVTSHGLRGVGRAQIQGHLDGTVKLVVEEDGPIIGATIVAQGAGEMIHELMYSVGWEALPQEAARFIHAHPTVSEAIGEALLAAAGTSLH